MLTHVCGSKNCSALKVIKERMGDVLGDVCVDFTGGGNEGFKRVVERINEVVEATDTGEKVSLAKKGVEERMRVLENLKRSGREAVGKEVQFWEKEETLRAAFERVGNASSMDEEAVATLLHALEGIRVARAATKRSNIRIAGEQALVSNGALFDAVRVAVGRRAGRVASTVMRWANLVVNHRMMTDAETVIEGGITVDVAKPETPQQWAAVEAYLELLHFKNIVKTSADVTVDDDNLAAVKEDFVALQTIQAARNSTKAITGIVKTIGVAEARHFELTGAILKDSATIVSLMCLQNIKENFTDDQASALIKFSQVSNKVAMQVRRAGERKKRGADEACNTWQERQAAQRLSPKPRV